MAAVPCTHLTDTDSVCAQLSSPMWQSCQFSSCLVRSFLGAPLAKVSQVFVVGTEGPFPSRPMRTAVFSHWCCVEVEGRGCVPCSVRIVIVYNWFSVSAPQPSSFHLILTDSASPASESPSVSSVPLIRSGIQELTFRMSFITQVMLMISQTGKSLLQAAINSARISWPEILGLLL